MARVSTFLLGLLGGVGGRREEAHHFQGHALPDHPGGHGGVDAAGPHRSCSLPRPAAGSRLGRRGRGGVVLHLQTVSSGWSTSTVRWVLRPQLAAHVLGRAGWRSWGDALFARLTLHLKRPGGRQPAPRYSTAVLEHGVLSFAQARAGTGQPHRRRAWSWPPPSRSQSSPAAPHTW